MLICSIKIKNSVDLTKCKQANRYFNVNNLLQQWILRAVMILRLYAV